MLALLDDVIEAHQKGRSIVLCTVVETRGSTPQKPGAAMLVFADGSQSGTLGGGCTEAEVKRQALTLLDSNDPKVVTFTLDDNFGWDDGLICGGRMTFLIQPIPAASSARYFESFHSHLRSGQGCTEAVVIDAGKAGVAAGARWLFDAEGRLAVSHLVGDPPVDTHNALVHLQERPLPYTQSGVAYIPILARCRLLLVGAGHVGQKVAQMASDVDFDVWVLDDRETYASKERFPSAKRLLVEPIGPALSAFVSDPNTYCLIMTRGHSNDEEALFHLARKPAAYVGLIGSRRKIRLIFEDLESQGIPREALDRVHAPLGIDIGSRTVPEIAISIVAHLIGHRNRGAEDFPPTRRATDPSKSTRSGHSKVLDRACEK